MNRDYETPNFKTPPKKTILTSSSKSALKPINNNNLNEEVSLEDIDIKIYEIMKSGEKSQKIHEIKEKTYRDMIKSNKIIFSNFSLYFF